MKNLTFILFFSMLFLGVYAQFDPGTTSVAWNTKGNSGTTSSNFIGTTDIMPLVFKTCGTERMRLSGDKPFFGIGIDPQAMLHLQPYIAPMPSPPEDGERMDFPKLLLLTYPGAGNTADNGFSISFFNRGKGILFKQQEQDNFYLEGPGGGLMIAPNGNIGMGTDKPKQKLHIVDGNLLISKTSAKDMDAPQSPNGSIFFGADANDNFPGGKWGIEYLNGEDNCYGLNFWRPWNPGGGGYFNYGLFLADNGNIGINKKDPSAKLDVNGSFKAQSADITGNLVANSATITTLTTTTLNIPNTIDNLSVNVLKAQTATVNGISNLKGNVVVGTSIQQAQLDVNGALNAQSANIAGKIKTKEVEVTLAGWPDFVFDKNYNLPTLSEVEQFITENQHLPNVPSAAEVEANGVNIGELNAILIQKVEELTLYILDLQKQINELKK